MRRRAAVRMSHLPQEVEAQAQPGITYEDSSETLKPVNFGNIAAENRIRLATADRDVIKTQSSQDLRGRSIR